MQVKDLIAEFSAIDTLPVELKSVEDALRARDVEDDIYYFYDLELNPNSFAGFIHREEIPFGEEKRYVSTITYAKLGEEYERLVCCKEMLHILDPDYLKAKTLEAVNILVSKIILPPEFVDPPNDGAHVTSDSVGLAHAIAVRLPLAAIELLRPAFREGKISIEKIAELAELPPFAVTIAMSDFWLPIHAALVKRHERATL